MKRKHIICLAAIAIIIIAAVVLLLTQKNHSEFRIQNSELSVTAESNETKPQVTPDVIEAEQTEAPAVEQTEETTAEETEMPAAEETENPAEEETREQPFLVQITEDDPSIGYVLVRMPNPVGLLPLPQEGEYKKTIRVAMPDGSEYINVLHITPNGFWMENANCEGQDCVKQGEVTLENREERILWNMIICLPHQLSAELITREEAEQMLK